MPEFQLRKRYYLCEYSDEYLNGLLELYPITYYYVCAKLEIHVDQAKALKIFREHDLDENAGLLIWRFGQLGMWGTLKMIADDAEKFVEREKESMLSGRYN